MSVDWHGQMKYINVDWERILIKCTAMKAEWTFQEEDWTSWDWKELMNSKKRQASSFKNKIKCVYIYGGMGVGVGVGECDGSNFFKNRKIQRLIVNDIGINLI